MEQVYAHVNCFCSGRQHRSVSVPSLAARGAHGCVLLEFGCSWTGRLCVRTCYMCVFRLYIKVHVQFLFVYVLYLFVLFLVRGILFALIWLVTFGKHKFWLFPNLTEDCGVLESFVPFYTHEVVTPKDDTKTPAEKKIPDKDGDEKGSSGDLAAAVDGKQDGDDGKVSGDVSDATEHGDGDTVAEEINNIKAVENDNSSQPVEQNS